MDGVPELTQAAVPSGGSFLYDFVASDAGTYWYHSHNRTWEQLARGLYGALIVEDADGGPEVDRDELLLIDDWRLTPEPQIDQRFGAMGDRSHGGRLGNWVTINGASGWRREVRPNERLRLRLTNAANARILVLELHGLEGWVVALDGQPLAAPERVGRLLLAPGQRADLIVDATAGEGSDALLVSLERDGGYAIATFRVDGIMAAPKARRAAGTGAQSSFAAARAGRRTARPAFDAGWCHGWHAERDHGGPRDGISRDGGPRQGLGVQWCRGLSGTTPARTRDRRNGADRHRQRDRMAPRHASARSSFPAHRRRRGLSARCATHCCWTVRKPPRSRSWPTTPATGSFTATCRSIPPAGWRPGFVSDEQLSPRRALPEKAAYAGRIRCSWIEEQRRGGNQHRLRGKRRGSSRLPGRAFRRVCMAKTRT